VAAFVPPDFEVPLGIETSEFVLEPLGPEHNDRDFNAWASPMEHVAATPGFPWGAAPDDAVLPLESGAPQGGVAERGPDSGFEVEAVKTNSASSSCR
jgi:hypothetical protein